MKIFISYRRDDSAYPAQAVYEKLSYEFGRESVFIDVDSIPLGVDFARHLREAVQQSDVLLAIIGPDWLHAPAEADNGLRYRLEDPRDFVRIELEAAMARDIPLIPVLVAKAKMPAPDELPAALRDLAFRNAAELRPGPDFHHQLQRLTAHIGKLTGDKTVTSRSHTLPTNQLKPQEPDGIGATFSFDQITRDPEFALGARLGSHTLRRVLGAGGGGVAYSADNPNTGETVCIKIAYPLTAHIEKLFAAAARGVRGIRALDSRNVARVYDLVRLRLKDGESFYLAMEFVPGESLGSWTRRQQDTPNAFLERLRTALVLVETMGHAHEVRFTDESGFELRGVLHGDLKPTNIIMHPQKGPVIVDFMLADVQRLRLRDDEAAIPRSDDEPITAAFGTPGFMAPEQESEGVCTVRTDIYGLGMTLLDLLFPDKVAHPSMLEASSKEENRLVSLLRSMTHRDPERRPPEMDIVLRVLRQLAEKVVRPRPTLLSRLLLRLGRKSGPKLRILSGPRGGEVVDVGRGSFSIGSVPGNDLVIRSARISRCHATLVSRRGHLVIDAILQGSVLVNGEPVESARLWPGDRVRLGDTEFTVEF